MTLNCAVCGNDYYADRTTCETCEDRLRDGLNEIEHLWLELPKHLQRGASKGDTIAGTRAPGMPPAEEVLDLISKGGIVTQLQVHEDDWRRARGFTATPWRGSLDQTLPGVVRFLRTNLSWACQHYADLDDLHKDLGRLLGRCRAITDGEKRERSWAAYCATENCGGTMRISISTPRSECPKCETEYQHEQLMQLQPDFLNRAAA